MPGRKLKLSFAALLALSVLAPAATATAAGTLYTNNYTDKQVAALSIGANGLLTPLPGSPFGVPDFPSGLAVTPDGRLLVTAFSFDDRIATQALAADGGVSPVGPALTAKVGGTPAVTPDGKYVYVPRKLGGVFAFAIGADGSLTQIGNFFGTNAAEMPALTPDGQYLMVPGYTTGSIERFTVQPDGTLTPLGTTMVGAETPLGARVTPDGKVLVMGSEPPGKNGKLYSFTIGADGLLTSTGPPVETIGGVISPPLISPNGKFLYIANGNEESITTYSISGTGVLSQVGSPAPTGLTQPEAMGMSVDARFLYVEPQKGQLIQAFSVAADGTLTKIGGTTSTGGAANFSTPVTRPAVPTAKLTVGPAIPDHVTRFDASGSSDVGATLTTFSWDFGDGTKLSNGGPTPKHKYKKAGIYQATVTVGDDVGCVGFVYTGQTAFCNAKGASTTVKVDTLPVLSGLRVTVKHGIAFRYKLDEKAKVRFTLQRKAGKKRKIVGGFTANAKRGGNRTKLLAKLGGRKLKPGRYLATAIATDSAGGKSAPAKAMFGLVRPR